MALYELMNRDVPVLTFDFDDMYIHVEDNELLPYALRDYIKDTDYSDRDGAKRSARDINRLKEYISSRILLLIWKSPSLSIFLMAAIRTFLSLWV